MLSDCRSRRRPSRLTCSGTVIRVVWELDTTTRPETRVYCNHRRRVAIAGLGSSAGKSIACPSAEESARADKRKTPSAGPIRFMKAAAEPNLRRAHLRSVPSYSAKKSNFRLLSQIHVARIVSLFIEHV